MKKTIISLFVPLIALAFIQCKGAEGFTVTFKQNNEEMVPLESGKHATAAYRLEVENGEVTLSALKISLVFHERKTEYLYKLDFSSIPSKIGIFYIDKAKETEQFQFFITGSKANGPSVECNPRRTGNLATGSLNLTKVSKTLVKGSYKVYCNQPGYMGKEPDNTWNLEGEFLIVPQEESQ